MKKPPSADEFETWADNPVTLWVMDAYDKLADEQRAAWLVASWDGNQANPLLLAELRARADAYRSMGESEYADLLAAHGQEEPNNAEAQV